MSVESYATLLNLKLIVPSSKSNYVAVDRDFWTHSYGALVAEVELDEAWYCKKYPDVRNALNKNIIETAKQHYIESGYFEHRMPREMEVDELWYLSQYDDVGAAIEKKVYRSAQEHFEEVGFKEGRLPYAGFSLSKIKEITSRIAR